MEVTKMTLREQFIKLARENIKKDCDVYDEGWKFNSVMDEYGKYFTLRKASKEETLLRSYSLVCTLFPFLFPEIGGSRSDYLAKAVADALYNLGISLTVQAPKEVRFKIIKVLYEKAWDYEVVVHDLKKYGFDLRARD